MATYLPKATFAQDSVLPKGVFGHWLPIGKSKRKIFTRAGLAMRTHNLAYHRLAWEELTFPATSTAENG